MFEATNRHCGPSCTSCSSIQPCWTRATDPRSAPAKAGMGQETDMPGPTWAGAHSVSWCPDGGCPHGGTLL